MIEISLADNLSGDLCLLELELANISLQFKSAQLVAKLRLDQVSVFNPIHIDPKSILNHPKSSLGGLFGPGCVQEALRECPGESWGCPGLHFGMILSSKIHPKSMTNRQ